METTSFTTFGEALRSLRKRSGLTQQQLATAIGMHRNAISRWEQDEFVPEYKGIVLELARVLCLDQGETERFLATCFAVKASLRNVPYQRNPLFTGREEPLEALHQCLQNTSAVALTQAYAVHGLGGIGKTQLAVEYAYRYGSEYTAVLWVQAETVEGIHTSLLSIAERLQLPLSQESDLQKVVQAVQHWLSTHNRWLLIWDNLEDLALLGRYLPADHQGKIVITTRQQVLGSLAQGMELPVMGVEEGLLFLLRRAKLVESRAGSEQMRLWQQRAPQEEVAARELVKLLGGLPLALDQAGAYIEETGCGLRGYLYLYRQQGYRLLERRGAPVLDHPDSTTTTFVLAYQRVQERDQLAADLLCLCAFLSPDEIPEELLEVGAEYLDVPLQRTVEGSRRIEQAIATLQVFSLVHRTTEAHSISLHRLVQEALRGKMDPTISRVWVERTVRALNASCPNVSARETTTWPKCQRYLAHIETCQHLVKQWDLKSLEAANLFSHAGLYLYIRGQYEQAGRLLEQALTIRQLLQEPNLAELVRNIRSLAEVHWSQGKYQQAEELYLRALALCEQYHMEEEHLIEVADNLSDLAVLYLTQGRYAEEEPLHLRAVQLVEQQPGLEDKLSIYLCNLACFYSEYGQYQKAEAVCLRATELAEQHLSTDDPLIAFYYSNLAIIYTAQGRYEEAEHLHKKARKIREELLGTEHPDLAEGLNELARTYLEWGKLEEAEALFARALPLCEQQLGSLNYHVTMSLDGLAEGRLYQGEYAEAEQLFRRALQIREQQLGSEHPYVALSLEGLARLSVKREEYAEAEQLFRRALAIREQKLHSSSPLIATCLRGLAELYLLQHRYEEVEPLLQRALSIVEQSLGVDHLMVAVTLAMIAELYRARKQNERAQSVLQQALAIYQQRCGTQHPDTLATCLKLQELRDQASVEEGSLQEK